MFGLPWYAYLYGVIFWSWVMWRRLRRDDGHPQAEDPTAARFSPFRNRRSRGGLL